jgi:hypothetical protein
MIGAEDLIVDVIDDPPRLPDLPTGTNEVDTADPSATRREIERLAALGPVEYSQQRKDAATRLNCQVTALDKEVKAAQRDARDTGGQGRALLLDEVEPWENPVDGAKLIDDLTDALRRYVSMSENELLAAALWVIHTYAFENFTCTPRLAITSPEKGCGKTTLLDVIGCLVNRPLLAANISAAAVYRTVECIQPTMLVDEADTFLRDNDELRGVLNSGHRRGGQVVRVSGEDYEPRAFSTFAPAAIAMIGKLPDTLNDRSIEISLRRRLPGEKLISFRVDRTEELRRLARMARRFADDNHYTLLAADPNMNLFNRQADNWRPLVAIADAAGGRWATAVRAAAEKISEANDDQSIRTQLLADIQTIFQQRGVDRLSSQELVTALTNLEDRPWPEWKNGKAITATALARLLAPLAITPGTKRLHDSTAKGYYFADFEDAFTRYLSAAVTSSQPNIASTFGTTAGVTNQQGVTAQSDQNPQENNECDAVTVPQTGAWEKRICIQPSS